jgi:hypothetical protein
VVAKALDAAPLKPSALYGNGRAAAKIIRWLCSATPDPRSPALLRKRNTY